MLNEDKVKLMARMAMYEKKKGKKIMKMTKYFQGDYVSWNMIKTAIAATVAYLIVAACWALYHLEYLMENLYTLDFADLIKKFLTYYVVLLVGYLVLSYTIYSIKYSVSMKSLKRFRANLKKVKQINQEEAKGGED
ncbi:MAG: hypothetical protein HFG39_12710 [Lachnospiraceae bacterium]|mgnify:FL=1|nr:hypothetical protein [Lachnospiraceae bacterium]